MKYLLDIEQMKTDGVTYEKLLWLISSEYTEEEIEKIKRAYELANSLHQGQFRQSGEPYIIHPISVAYILAELHVDCDTICAGLLHDVVEDTDITVSKIEEMFGIDVSVMVDGVTKISKLNFSTKEEERLANTRKIILTLAKDIRTIMIKLADRLHNMRTLQFKSREKQRENALETMELYVPIAYMLGAYRIKTELEDLSLRYLQPEEYQELKEKMEEIEKASTPCIEEMLGKIYEILSCEDAPSEVKVRMKNICSVYKRLKRGRTLDNIHELISFKIMVDEVDRCYLLLRPIHETYKPYNGKMKDYICNPKTNQYRSLHTTVFGPDDRLVQMQIRTFDMDKVASFGLAAYWGMHDGNEREIMQQQVREKYQFYDSLLEINHKFVDNHDFVSQVRKEILSDKVYVYGLGGKLIELPEGATPLDLAYKTDPKFGNTIDKVIVNDKEVPLDYVLHTKDRVRFLTNAISYGPNSDWVEKAQTTYAKQKILESLPVYKKN